MNIETHNKNKIAISYLVWDKDGFQEAVRYQRGLWSKLFNMGFNLKQDHGVDVDAIIADISTDTLEVIIPIAAHLNFSRKGEFRMRQIAPNTYSATFCFEERDSDDEDKQEDHFLKFLKGIYSFYNFPIGIVSWEDDIVSLFANADTIPGENLQPQNLDHENILNHPEHYSFRNCIVNREFYNYEDYFDEDYEPRFEQVEVTGLLISNGYN